MVAYKSERLKQQITGDLPLQHKLDQMWAVYILPSDLGSGHL